MRVALYARVSTQRQAQSQTIEQQPGAGDRSSTRGLGGKIRRQDRLAGDAASGPPLALPLGAPPLVLAELVHRTSTAGARRAPRARRPLPSAWCPNLTNQR